MIRLQQTIPAKGTKTVVDTEEVSSMSIGPKDVTLIFNKAYKLALDHATAKKIADAVARWERDACCGQISSVLDNRNRFCSICGRTWLPIERNYHD